MQEQMLRLTPNGCIDAVNGRVENDECPDYSVLSNWVPSSDTPKQWVPRPAAVSLSGALTTITCQTVVGNNVVGMYNDPAGSGTDLPFVFNLLTSTFLTVNNVIIGTNTPTSPSSGDWQPPHAEAIGAYVLISHPGFNGIGNNFYGAVNLAAYTSPAKQILVTSGSTWTVPADWNNSSNSIVAIGAGANGVAGGNGGGGGTGNPGTIGGNGGTGGAGGAGGSAGAGGHGGSATQITNVALTPGTQVNIQVGTAGAPTWFNNTSVLQAAGGSSGSNVGTLLGAGAAGTAGNTNQTGGSPGNVGSYATGGNGGGGGNGAYTGGAGGAAGGSLPQSGGGGSGGAA